MSSNKIPDQEGIKTRPTPATTGTCVPTKSLTKKGLRLCHPLGLCGVGVPTKSLTKKGFVAGLFRRRGSPVEIPSRICYALPQNSGADRVELARCGLRR